MSRQLCLSRCRSINQRCPCRFPSVRDPKRRQPKNNNVTFIPLPTLAPIPRIITASPPPRPALFRRHHPTTTSATPSPRSPASMERPAAHLCSLAQAATLRDRPPIVLFGAARDAGKEFPFPAVALSSVIDIGGRLGQAGVEIGASVSGAM
jgi:hypothetical protein